MLELLSYGFMQRALMASVIMGTVCSVIGVFVLLKGLSFIGAGTSHAAFAGVVLGYLIGINPMAMAVLFGLLTVWTTGYLEERGKMKLDASIGILYTSTMALAILFIGLMKSYNAEIYGYLFGSILSVTSYDLGIITVLGALVLSAVFVFYKEFHFIVFDREMAEAAGIPAGILYYVLLSLIGLTVVVSLKSVGAILVFAMILIPAATAYQFTYSMKAMILVSVLVGIITSVGGVFLSFYLDLPSGAVIVLLATLLFFVSVGVSPKNSRRRAPGRNKRVQTH
jgi:ABC-type Mn2+/Zn2+ transport system permease subunit